MLSPFPELELARKALSKRGRAESPLRALSRLTHELVEQKHPFAKLTPDTIRFWETVQRSAALLARGRELRDRFVADLARIVADAVNQPDDDPEAELFGSMLVTVWTVAYRQALRRLQSGESNRVIRTAFLNLLDRGLKGIAAAMKGTPYT